MLLTVVGLVVAAAFVLALAAITIRVLRVERPSNEPGQHPDLVPIHARLAEVELAVKRLPSLWEHERSLAEAFKDEGTKQHRKAAAERRKFERGAHEGSDDGEDGEDEEAARFLAEHGEGGGPQGVLPLHPDVAGDPEEDLRQRAAAAGVTPFL